MLSTSTILRCRRQTPGVRNYIHLNNAGASLMSKNVFQAIQDYLALEMEMGGYEAAAHQRKAISAFSDVVAQLLNATPDQIAYAASATDAYNRALSAIPFEQGDVIVTTQDDYVSNQIAFLQLQKKYKLTILHSQYDKQGGADLDHLEQLIRLNHPRLVAVTHVPTNSGLIQDVERIGEWCKHSEAWYLVDACQSAGQLPLDVKKINCDFLSATFRKFLRGPRGSGVLYVSDRALEQQLEPAFLDLHSASWISPDQYRPYSDARSFELWERPYAVVMGSKAATEEALELGLDNIRQSVQHIADYCRRKLSEIPAVKVMDHGANLCGIVTFHVEGRHPMQLKEALFQHRINSSLAFREYAWFDFNHKNIDWALRVSPHYYNTQEEIDEFIDRLKLIIA